MGRLASWEVSDAFWARVAPLIPAHQRDPHKVYKMKPGNGRKPLPARQVFEAILFVLRTGIQWKALPKERFGSASSVHRYFQEWETAGVFEALWQKGLCEYDEFEGIGWEWQSIDGCMVKAPLARESVGKNPTDRGKMGTKRSVLTDARGVPVSIVLSGANTHDVTLLEATLDAVVIQRPDAKDVEQHLCADAAYVGAEAERQIQQHDYTPHVRSRGKEREDKMQAPEKKARRWVVEVAHSWLNRFRKLLVRYEKKARNYRALVMLANAIIAFRMIHQPDQPNLIYG